MTLNPVTFYDLLGVDPTLSADAQDANAAKHWPNDRVNATEGFNVSDDSVTAIDYVGCRGSLPSRRSGPAPTATSCSARRPIRAPAR